MKLTEIISPARRDEELTDWLFSNFVISTAANDEITREDFTATKMLYAGRIRVYTEDWYLAAKKSLSLNSWPIKFNGLRNLTILKGSSIGNYNEWLKMQELVVGNCDVASGFADYAISNVKYVELHNAKVREAEFEKMAEAKLDILYAVEDINMGFDGDEQYYVHARLNGKMNFTNWSTDDVFELQNYLIEHDLRDKLFKD